MLSNCAFRLLTAHSHTGAKLTWTGVQNVAQTGNMLKCINCGKPTLLSQVSQFSVLSQAARGKLVNASRAFTKNVKLPFISHIMRQTTTTAGKTLKLGYVETTNIPPHATKWVGRWLLTCAGMTFGAVVLGGITRLTESGLSMTDWRLMGRKPPRTQEEWEAEFEKYKQFPEYKHVSNTKEMTLSDFKFIFWMEYGHRMWGRAVGAVFLLPAVFFLSKGWISKSMKPRLLVYGSLIGFQGLLGWYMVKSGLNVKTETEIPRVSQYRLAAHLGTAFLLYALFLWGAFSHLLPPQAIAQIPKLPMIRGMAHSVKTLTFITAISGAFVAGLDAGLVYNSWPKFAEKWIPDDLLAFKPTWKNMFENPTCVQFNHRALGELTFLSVLGLFWVCRKAPLPPRTRLAVNCLMGMVCIQVALGITTLLTMVKTEFAASHQAGSLALLSMAVWLTHELKRFPK